MLINLSINYVHTTDNTVIVQTQSMKDLSITYSDPGLI